MELRIRCTVRFKASWRQLHIGVRRSLKSVVKALSRAELKGYSLRDRFQGLWALADGNYRVVYRQFENTLILLDVGHRSVIYDQTIIDWDSSSGEELSPI